MKKALLTLLLAVLAIGLGMPKAGQAKLRAYYSGDAVEFNNKTIVASTNMGRAEIYVLENGQLALKSAFRSFDAINSGKDDYYDVALKYQGSRLYAYLVDGTWLYQYDITDPAKPAMVTKIHDNSWDWFLGVRVTKDGVMTIGTKGVKYYNHNLQVVDAYKSFNAHQASIQTDWGGRYLINADENRLAVLDRQSRQNVVDAALAAKESHGRKAIVVGNRAYVVDDRNLNVYDTSGRLIKQLAHGGKFGYDVAVAHDGKFVYASVGNAVIKVDIKTMKIVKRADTTNAGAKEGWAMGLKMAGDKIVVFNNSSVIVLDKDLRLAGSAKASFEALRPSTPVSVREIPIYGTAGTPVQIIGRGFGYNEMVEIDFAGEKSYATANDEGMFSKIVTVPQGRPRIKLINLLGLDSRIKYQITFEVK